MFNKYSSRILNDNIIRHYSSPNLTIASDGKDIKLSVESLLAGAKVDNWKPSNKSWYQRNYERNNDYELYLEDFQYLIDWDTYTFKPLISPYSPNLVKRMLGEVGNIDIISYGQSSYGYDARLHEEVYVFTNTNGGEVDPKNFDKDLLVKPKVWDSDNGRYVVIPPNGFLLGKTMEYFHVPRNVNVTCLGKSTIARCFTGDTKISLANNTFITFKEMIGREAQGEKFFGYGVDMEGEVVITELKNSRLVGKNEEIYEVTLDNNEIIECTGDHKFVMKDGSEVEAKNLLPNDSLMPLYRVQSRGYEAVLQPIRVRFTSTQTLADQWNCRHEVYNRDKEIFYHRHHKDHNKLNNYPTNIEIIEAGEHIRQHNLERFETQEARDKLSSRLKEAYANNSKNPIWQQKFIEKSIKGANLFWHDDNYSEIREATLEKRRIYYSNLSLDDRTRMRERFINIKKTQKYINKWRAAIAVMWANEERVKMQQDIARKINIREEISEDVLRTSLEKTGSIRATARELKCDRTTFRRFRHVILEFKDKWELSKVTLAQMVAALKISKTMAEAARKLGISKSCFYRRKDALSTYFDTPLADNHKVLSVVKTDRKDDVYCLTSVDTGNFALAAGVFVNNCSIVVNVTPLEAGWHGTVTLELSNTSNLPVRVYLEEGICQFIFMESEAPCEVSYADRKGKYMGQLDVTLSKV